MCSSTPITVVHVTVLARRLMVYYVLMSLVVIASCDYPPPSAHGHEHYSQQNHQSWGGHEQNVFFSGGGTDRSNRCMDMPANLSLCRGIGYTQMRLPNLFHHETIKEVTQQARSWVHLLTLRCHGDTQIFLCAMFAPVCLDQPIPPCRSLCEAVKSGCEEQMLKYGYSWPEILSCQQFPSDAELCIGIRPPEHTEEHTRSCFACSHRSATSDEIIANMCSSEFVMRVKVEGTVAAGNDLKLVTAKKKKIYRRIDTLKAKEVREGALFIDRSGGAAECDCPALDSIKEQRSNGSFLVMGRKRNNRLVLSFLEPITKKSREISRAMKLIKNNAHSNSRAGESGTKPRNTDICKRLHASSAQFAAAMEADTRSGVVGPADKDSRQKASDSSRATKNGRRVEASNSHNSGYGNRKKTEFLPTLSSPRSPSSTESISITRKRKTG